MALSDKGSNSSVKAERSVAVKSAKIDIEMGLWKQDK